MTQYVALDVSLEETKLHVLDEAGNRVWRGRCATDPAVIAATVRRYAPSAARIGLETGPLTTWLWTALTASSCCNWRAYCGTPASCHGHLFEIQAQHLRDCRERCRTVPDSRDVIQAMLQQGASNYAVDRLIRYEATVWRQVARTLYALEILWIVVNPRSDPRVFGRINEARGWWNPRPLTMIGQYRNRRG